MNATLIGLRAKQALIDNEIEIPDGSRAIVQWTPEDADGVSRVSVYAIYEDAPERRDWELIAQGDMHSGCTIDLDRVERACSTETLTEMEK